MIIRPSEIHWDFDVAKLAAMEVAFDLGVKGNFKLATMWDVRLHLNDREAFVSLACEKAIAIKR